MRDQQKEIVDVVVEAGAKTALSVIPVGGALITAVWDAVKSNCAQKRLDEWKYMLETRLASVETTLENIGQNENFTSAIFAATDAAIKTAESEKRKYLANAVLNSATCDLEESIVMMFFNMISQYTLWHIKILEFFVQPTRFPGIAAENYYMGSPKQPLFDTYPELRQSEGLTDKIIRELYNDGLMSNDNLNCTMTGAGMVSSRATKLGKQFIKFLSN